MPVYALDTSLIIAALLSWHERHDEALSCLQEAMEGSIAVVIPLHALVEAYSVMTRLPSPHRLSSKDAWALLSGTFKSAKLAKLETKRVWSWLESLAVNAITGGQAYDAMIYESARSSGATHLLTLNPKHFEQLGDELQLVVPQQ